MRAWRSAQLPFDWVECLRINATELFGPTSHSCILRCNIPRDETRQMLPQTENVRRESEYNREGG